MVWSGIELCSWVYVKKMRTCTLNYNQFVYNFRSLFFAITAKNIQKISGGLLKNVKINDLWLGLRTQKCTLIDMYCMRSGVKQFRKPHEHITAIQHSIQQQQQQQQKWYTFTVQLQHQSLCCLLVLSIWSFNCVKCRIEVDIETRNNIVTFCYK